MWRRRLVLAAAAAVALAACGTPTAPSHPRPGFTYATTPSVSALMICRPSTVREIDTDLGARTLFKPLPTWQRHRYSCTYRYATGSMTLSVKELPSLAATSAYVAFLRRSMGDTGAINLLGQVAFSTSNGSAVTRKDNKVLLVDVRNLPPRFGRHRTSRSDVALSVVDLILSCWRGD